MLRKLLLVISVLVALPLAAKAQQKSPEEDYTKAYEALNSLLIHSKSEGIFLAMTKMGAVPKDKARKLTDLMREHGLKYEAKCHMASLQEYSVEIRNAAYLQLENGNDLEEIFSALFLLWPPFVANGTDELKRNFLRMQEAAKKSEQSCMDKNSKLLQSEITKLGLRQ